MNKVLEEISKIGIVPVIALDHVEDAAPLAKALCDGGLPCAEVTFRTAAAEESIRIMAEQFPEMLVGAGTVLTTEQVDRAVNAGAKFIVSRFIVKPVECTAFSSVHVYCSVEVAAFAAALRFVFLQCHSLSSSCSVEYLDIFTIFCVGMSSMYIYALQPKKPLYLLSVDVVLNIG